MAGALDGILVVSLEQAVAAPLCTCRLADAGARVIKIERAEGDFARDYDHVVHGESAYFVWLNRGKQSVVLDFKSPGDAALLHRIVARADVLVQNLAPGAAERAGFGSAAMRQAHPRLITCDISGYGETGPYAQMKAYDLLIQCESGLASVTGSPDAPGRVGVSAADIASGMYAHAAILEALLERERTGRGKGVAVSMFDALADWMTVPLLHHDYGRRAPSRVGLSHPSIAPYGAFATQDGKQVVLGVQNEREWKALCAEVLGDARLADDPRFISNSLRVQNRIPLDAIISNIFRGLPKAAVVGRLRSAKIAFASLNGVKELSGHPQLRRMEVASPTGPVALPAPPPIWRDAEPVQPGPSPALGEHTQAIREEFAP
jgi:crotonobetainyl-CoA:carnitine CoA-transferase CaiB-like acyl-CoA transferase